MFVPFDKIPRWNREVVITEKIDGTNAAIIIWPLHDAPGTPIATVTDEGGVAHAVFAQSRTRLIHPGKTTDNYGFAAWVQENASELVALLGPGRHFGEWYGKGIQRGYGLDHKRFALFNVKQWDWLVSHGSGENPFQIHPDLPIDVVPVLAVASGPNDAVTPWGTATVDEVLERLAGYGSVLVPGFERPEGVVLYHTAAGQLFKATLENDDAPKGVRS